MQSSRLSSLGMAFAIVTLALALTAGIVRAQTAAPVNTAMSISKVPFVITKPGLYMVKKDLVLASATGNAITINASDVTLDLGGHVLSSSAPQDISNNSYGVTTTGTAQDITVRNGTLRNFSIGVYLDTNTDSSRVLVEDVTVANCGYYGIHAQGYSSEVRGCHVLDAGYQSANSNIFGISAYGISVKVVGNEVGNISTGLGRSSYGIYLYVQGTVLVENNRVSATSAGTYGICSTGIFAETGVFVVGNTVTNFTIGLKFDATSGGKYRDNLTKACATPFSGGTAVGTGNN
jgi:nitrous oxidase accessory protein NosD